MRLQTHTAAAGFLALAGLLGSPANAGMQFLPEARAPQTPAPENTPNIAVLTFTADLQTCRIAFSYALESDKTGAEKITHQNELNQFLASPAPINIMATAFALAIKESYEAAGEAICGKNNNGQKILTDNIQLFSEAAKPELSRLNPDIRPASARIDVVSIKSERQQPKPQFHQQII